MRFVECRCGHAKSDHEREGFAPQCTASGCACLQYRPITAPAAPVGVASAPTADQIIAAGKRSPFKRTVALAEKVETQVAGLRGVLRDERQASEAKRQQEADKQAARAEVERLERELRAAKARLSGRAPATASAPKPPGDGTCPDCGKGGLNNVGVHRSRAHGFKAAS